MQTVKRRFFAMRNGVVADTLRRAGSPFRVIFGLNLPQIVEIAAGHGADRPLADELWANTTTRESMLLAPMLVDASVFPIEDARRWASEAPADEVTDILCHRLLRKVPYAWTLVDELAQHDADYRSAYTALRLAFNMVGQKPARAREVARKYATVPRLAALAGMLNDEAEFLMEC